jgi:AcrR family transcriptional regulator
MRTDGVGALSLSKVARHIGVKPPSLYQYFPSKNAVYDEIFRRGWHESTSYIAERVKNVESPIDRLRISLAAMLTWSVEHPVHAQLLHWRPVPGFVPSEASMAEAENALSHLRALVQAAVDAGQLRPRAAQESGIATLTVIGAGIISQQLSNEPDAPPGRGRFTKHADELMDVYLAYFGTGGDSA